MSFDPQPKEVTAEWFAKRSLDKLPGDLLKACDEIRKQKTEIITLKADLIAANKAKLRLGIQKSLLMMIVAGACGEGIKVAAMALFKLFAH